MQTFGKSSSPNYSTEFSDIVTKDLWVCVIEICSNGGATYIIGKIIAKDNFNIANLMHIFEKSSSPKLLNRILRYCTLIVLGYVSFMFVQMVVPPKIFS